MIEQKTALDMVVENPEDYTVYMGELLLRDWADNSAGESVEFWLNGESDIHPFKTFKSNKRTPGGSRFLAFIIEVNDDENLINQKQKQRAAGSMSDVIRGGKHSQSAALLCKDQGFHSYLLQKSQKLPPDQQRIFASTMPHGLYTNVKATKGQILLSNADQGEEFAKLFLYWWCAISSRREIDFSPKAFNAFYELREEYYAWSSGASN